MQNVTRPLSQARPWLHHCAHALLLWALCIATAQADVPVARASVSASGSALGATSAGMAADGNPDTRWVAESRMPGRWLALEFPVRTYVTALRVSEPQPRIRSWRIEVLRDGVWRQVLAGTGIPQGKLSIPPTRVDGVKLLIDSTSAGPVEISEFAAWASGRSACVPPAGAGSVNVTQDMDCAGLVISQPCNRHGPAAPMFVLADGARLRNVTLIDSYVSCDGACTLENVHWRNNCLSAIQQSAVIQSLADHGGRDISILGGSAFGRFGALVHLNTTASALNVRQFVFSGYAESLNGYPPEMSKQLRIRLEEVTLTGTLRGGVVQVRADKGDQASIRRLRITAYKRGEPLVCNVIGVQQERLTSFGEQWEGELCDVGVDDVKAAPG